MEKELKKRWITSIIALPVLIYLIQFKEAFCVFIGLISIIAIYEYYSIFVLDLWKNDSIMILGLLIAPAMIYFAYFGQVKEIMGLIFLNFLIGTIISSIKFSKDPDPPVKMCYQIFGTTYIPLLLTYVVLIRIKENGILWIYLMLLLVIACDTGAYFTGKKIGRNKLCPAVSPGKTIEGFIGGLLLCIIAGLIYKFFLLPEVNWINCIILSSLVSVVGPLGDMFESMLKRTTNTKDSGSILQGHGGILDRIDAMLFTAPVVYYFIEYIIKSNL